MCQFSLHTIKTILFISLNLKERSSMKKVLTVLLVILLVGVGAWALFEAGIFDGTEDQTGLFEGPERTGNNQEVQQGQEISGVEVIASGDNSLYGQSAVESENREEIRRAVKPAVVTADTTEQFNRAANLLLRQQPEADFNGDNSNAVMVFMGLRTSSGYGIDFDRTEKVDNSLNVYVNTQEPSGPVTQNEREAASPYLVLSIPEPEWQPSSDTNLTVIDEDGNMLIQQEWGRGLANDFGINGSDSSNSGNENNPTPENNNQQPQPNNPSPLDGLGGDANTGENLRDQLLENLQ